MSNDKLTCKQERFALNLFAGMTQRDAWIDAGYSSRYALAVIDSNACVLANTSKIIVRLQELNAPLIAKIQSKKEAKLEILEKIYTHEPLPETITARERIQAVSEHNKMEGDYAPERRDHTFNGDSLSNVLLKLRGYNPKQIEEAKDAVK